MAKEQVMLGTLIEQKETDTEEVDDNARLFDMEEHFPFRSETAHRLYPHGGKTGFRKVIGEGNKPTAYIPCPAPKYDKKRDKWLRCGWEPTGGVDSEATRVEVIRHHRQHWSWWLEKNKQEDGRPPLHVVIDYPVWVDPDELNQFDPNMSGIARAVYNADKDASLNQRVKEEEIERRKVKKLRDNKVEEDL